MAGVSVALVVAATVAISQPRSEGRREVEFLRAATERFEAVRVPIWIAPPYPAPPLGPALALPAASGAARLSAIPDAMLNDPPAARYAVPVSVRGRAGIAALDAPVVLAWSEDGYWYELSSTDRTLLQLIELASALE